MQNLDRCIAVSEPVPRSQPRRYEAIVWASGSKTLLRPKECLNVDLGAVFEKRQSRREFLHDPSDDDLGDLLWLIGRCRSSRPSLFGPDQESRPYPSAGAMHPIHILVARAGNDWYRYEPVDHSLVELPGTASSAQAARDAAEKLLVLGRGLLVALVCEPGRTGAKYEHPESLVWRDAGVVLGYLSIVAEALGMPLCPLGLTGDPYVRELIPARVGDLVGAGLAVLGGADRNL